MFQNVAYRPTVYKTGDCAKCSDVCPGWDFCIYGMHNAYGLGNKYVPIKWTIFLSQDCKIDKMSKERKEKKYFSLFKDNPLLSRSAILIYSLDHPTFTLHCFVR